MSSCLNFDSIMQKTEVLKKIDQQTFLEIGAENVIKQFLNLF